MALKIVDKRKGNHTFVSNMCVGDFFVYNEDVYIKTESDCGAVCLSNGKVCDFFGSTLIIPIETVELHIGDKK